MRIAVIAAQGRAGQAFVNEALSAGHAVRAGIRGDSPFAPNELLTTVQCDATDLEQVNILIEGCDAVVSLLGHIPGSKADVQTRAMGTIIDAMQASGIRRVISLTGTGVRQPGDKPSLIDKVANALIMRIDPDRVHDGIHHVKLLQASDADYTVVRVLKLTNGNAGRYGLNLHGPAKLLTPRKEVARTILECLEYERFLRECPVITPMRKGEH